MRKMILLTILYLCPVTLLAEEATADRPLVEQYLHSGDLANGELALEDAIAADSDDDQARFGLGVLRVVRAIERFGQRMHEYGLKPQNNFTPFVRMPVPENPDPAPISYTDFRRVLDEFGRDLMDAEATLAGVDDDAVRLPLKLGELRMDLDSDGEPTDRLLEILQALSRRELEFLKDDPDFEVHFDRGDVAWLRAYCHLLAGMIDGLLAVDSSGDFHHLAGNFGKPVAGEAKERKPDDPVIVQLQEPRRLNRFRLHWVEVAKLNREAWRHIRAEEDDDFEWLPNAKQTSVFRTPVTREMIDAWLEMFDEAEALLEGRKTLPTILDPLFARDGRRLNWRVFLDDPPRPIEINGKFDGEFYKNLTDEYYTSDPPADFNALLRAWSLFNGMSGVPYAVWFN